MISMPFDEAFLSGSRSALASGTDVAITFAPAAIGGVDPGDLLRHVVVRVDLRHAHAPALEIVLGLVDALLEHRPEGAGVAVRHHRDLDRRLAGGECPRRHTKYREPGCGGASLEEQASAGDLGQLLLDEVVVHDSPFPWLAPPILNRSGVPSLVPPAGARPESDRRPGRRGARSALPPENKRFSLRSGRS